MATAKKATAPVAENDGVAEGTTQGAAQPATETPATDSPAAPEVAQEASIAASPSSTESTAAAAAEVKEYVVLENILHKSKFVVKNTILKLTDEEAKDKALVDHIEAI